MKPFKIAVLFLCIVASQQSVRGKDRIETKFGAVLKSDFSPSSPAIDSGAEAVILFDIGSCAFEGNSSGDFSMVFKRHKRVLLKNKSSFDDLASIKINLYTGYYQYTEDFRDFEASTFNLENGQLVETKLTKTSLFKEKLTKDYTNIKFTFPNLKEGSIIEYSYTIRSPFHNGNIPSWSFQGNYPIIWSDYQVTIPPVYNFEVLRQGYLPYAVDSTNEKYETYHIIDNQGTGRSEVYIFSGNAKWAEWAVKDAPPFKTEKYLSTSSDYISKIKFQLHSIRYSDSYTKMIIKDWFSVTNDLLNDEDFGLPLSQPNDWCENDLKKVTAGLTGLAKAKKIYEYVRDNFTCNDDDGKYLSDGLKKTFQAKKGGVADINLLLTALMTEQGINAHPVILSTRDHGKATVDNAILSQYNYVISQITIDSTYYLLDASIPQLGFGKLPLKCYSGSGRLVDKMPYIVSLTTDSLSEGSNTFVFISNDDSLGYSGSINSKLGYYNSLEVRDKLKKMKQDEFLKEFSKKFPPECELSNMTIDSLDNLDLPITIKNDVKLKFEEDIIYFSPMVGIEAWKNNPFVAATRVYPVEMPYRINESYVLNMEIPKGYEVDELPKSARVKLNDDEGMFEYLIGRIDNVVQLKCRLILYKANFTPEDYQTLRDFFTEVVNKESEEVVFKKAK